MVEACFQAMGRQVAFHVEWPEPHKTRPDFSLVDHAEDRRVLMYGEGKVRMLRLH